MKPSTDPTNCSSLKNAFNIPLGHTFKNFCFWVSLFFVQLMASQTLEYPKKTCEGAQAMPDDLYSWCEDTKDNYYNECECNYEKAVKAYKNAKEEIARQRESIKSQINTLSSEKQRFYDAGVGFMDHMANNEGDFESNRAKAISNLEKAIAKTQQILPLLTQDCTLRQRLQPVTDCSDLGAVYKRTIEQFKGELAKVKAMELEREIVLQGTDNTSGSTSIDNDFWNETSSGSNTPSGNSTAPSRTTTDKRQAEYDAIQEKLRKEKEYQEFLNDHRAQAMQEIDASSGGNVYYSGAKKLGYGLGASAATGQIDAESLVRGSADILSGILASSAANRARKEQEAKERRQREQLRAEQEARIQRQIGNREKILSKMDEYDTFPSSSTPSRLANVYFICLFMEDGGQKALKAQAGITPVFPVSRYADGSWPYRQGILNKLAGHHEKKARLFGYFESYDAAMDRLKQLTSGLSETGMVLDLVDVSDIFKEKDPNAMATQTDFWGQPIQPDKKTQKQTEEDDFWNN